MKALVAITFVLSFSIPAHAKCIVEILTKDGDPLGYIYQDAECKNAMNKCKVQLPRVNVPGAVCEITLDIPGSKENSLTSVNIN